MEALLYCLETLPPAAAGSNYLEGLEDRTVEDVKATQQRESDWRRHVPTKPEPTICYVAPERSVSLSVLSEDDNDEEEDFEKSSFKPYSINTTDSTIFAPPAASTAPSVPTASAK